MKKCPLAVQICGVALFLCAAFTAMNSDSLAAPTNRQAPSFFLKLCLSKTLTPPQRSFINFLSKDADCHSARARLREIEILYLGPNDYVDWRVIKELVNLRDLAIESAALTSLDFVQGLKSLQMLVIVGVKPAHPLDLSPLAALPSLVVLRLGATAVERHSLRVLVEQRPRLQVEQTATTIKRLFVAP